MEEETNSNRWIPVCGKAQLVPDLGNGEGRKEGRKHFIETRKVRKGKPTKSLSS